MKYTIVLGESVDGERVTLCDARVINPHSLRRQVASDDWQKFESHELDAVEAFIGAHLPLGSDTLVRGITVSFHLLDDWAWVNKPFVNRVPGNDETLERIEYRVPKPVVFRAFGGKTRIVAGLNRTNSTWHDEQVTRPAAIVIEFDDPIRYGDVLEVFTKPLQYFLTFACSWSTHLLDLSFRTDNDAWVQGEVRIPKEIWTLKRTSTPTEIQQLRPEYWEYLLPLSRIETRIGDVLEKWMELWSRAESALDLFCSILLGPPQYLETRFLLVIQALEVYHRRGNFVNKLMPTGEWRKRWRALAAAVASDPELRDWVDERQSDFGNEPRLRERLAELVQHGGDHALRYLRNDFVEVATATRHALTHYDPSSSRATGADLYWLIEEAMALMEACLLRDLDLTDVEVFEATKDTRRITDLRNNRR
jgi:hypothetical protein